MKKILPAFYTGLSLILALSSLYLYTVCRDYQNVKKSPFLGNKKENIKRLREKEGGLPFSFGFVTDTENSDVSACILLGFLKGDIDFLVLGGDSVNDSLVSEHRMFWHTISRLKPDVPIFWVPSNHDVEPESQIHTPGKFYRNDFERIYGPLNFSFVYNNCLFIFVSNIRQDGPRCTEYLRETLSKKAGDIIHTFVFCPTPLKNILNKVYPKKRDKGRMDMLVEKYMPDYVISGDYHRHIEFTDNNGIQYITSGSGGSHMHGNTPFGRFKSGTKITVYSDGIMKEILVSRGIPVTDNSIRRYIYDKLIPPAEPYIPLLPYITVLLFINFLLSIYAPIRYNMIYGRGSKLRRGA